MSGLYLHIPFCKRKCIYCNFYSVAKLGVADAFISALALEMEEARGWFPCHHFNTLYFGGGTPTLLSYSQLEKITTALKSHFSFAEDMEFTIEANPEQINRACLQGLLKLGINRLSIGVQSFSNQILSALGRLHTAEQAHKAVICAAEAGFSNISIDLIYGVAERPTALWQKELQLAFALPVTHLSAYSLTVEENTILAQRLKKQNAPPPDVNVALRDYEILQQEVAKAGFRQYEISNYCKEGCHSRHNSACWDGTPYLGLGPAAHSFTGAMRRWNLPHLENYISSLENRNRYWEAEQLSLNDHYNEYLLLGLRREKGVDLDYITTHFGERYRTLFLEQLSHISPDCYLRKGSHIQLSASGLLLADSITATLFI